MVTYKQIIDASKQQLGQIYQDLLMERMKMDKDFSIFLDSNELSEVDMNTSKWKKYKEMLTKYSDIKIMIHTTQFYLNK